MLGLDISTTGAKALLIDETGALVSSNSHPLSLSRPNPLWSEQNPSDWWEGMTHSIRRTIDEVESDSTVSAVGLTGQMHGLVILDEHGEVLRPAILWNDQRTGKQCDDIRKRIGKERLIQITGNDALTGFTAPKLLWVRENEPAIYERIQHILLPKDYIRFKLTGQYAMDKAGSAGTLLLDIKTRSWSNVVLKNLEIPSDWLPSLFEGPEITGRTQSIITSTTGLSEGIPVVAGGGDQSAGAVGMGAVVPGIVALVLGTSGVVFATTKEPFIEPEGRLHSFCHAVPERWHLMGVMLSAAGSLQWYKDTFASTLSFEELTKIATEAPACCDGLLFLPYLTGERTPHHDPLARGAFIGLSIQHSQAHMIRAVMEGVAFNLRESFELMQSAGLTDIDQIRVSGGGAKSPLWKQILADVFNEEVVTVNTTEGASFGAALLAGVGVGVWNDVDEAVQKTTTVTDSYHPCKDSVLMYKKSFDVFRSLYPALKDIFPQFT